MEDNLRNWLEKDGVPLLRNAGICEGQIVLDKVIELQSKGNLV